MRTTVTLDADVEQALREVMARDGVSFKVALNESIRRGLLPRPEYSYTTPAIDMGPLFDLHDLKQVIAAMDEEDDLARLAKISAQLSEDHAS